MDAKTKATTKQAKHGTRPAPEPTWLKAARATYGGSFEVKPGAELDESVAEWAKLGQAQRDFALAHLL